MKTIYLLIGLMMLAELSGCTQRPVIESNRQNTQPLLTQMLCPMCDVPSLTPPVAKATPPASQPVESKTISTIDNPPPASETPAATDTVATTETAAVPQDIPAQPAPVAAPSGSSKKVITLDLNAPDLGVH